MATSSGSNDKDSNFESTKKPANGSRMCNVGHVLANTDENCYFCENENSTLPKKVESDVPIPPDGFGRINTPQADCQRKEDEIGDGCGHGRQDFPKSDQGPSVGISEISGKLKRKQVCCARFDVGPSNKQRLIDEQIFVPQNQSDVTVNLAKELNTVEFQVTQPTLLAADTEGMSFEQPSTSLVCCDRFDAEPSNRQIFFDEQILVPQNQSDVTVNLTKELNTVEFQVTQPALLADTEGMSVKKPSTSLGNSSGPSTDLAENFETAVQLDGDQTLATKQNWITHTQRNTSNADRGTGRPARGSGPGRRPNWFYDQFT